MRGVTGEGPGGMLTQGRDYKQLLCCADLLDIFLVLKIILITYIGFDKALKLIYIILVIYKRLN